MLLRTSNIREVIKFYNLGDKTFETDFKCHHRKPINKCYKCYYVEDDKSRAKFSCKGISKKQNPMC